MAGICDGRVVLITGAGGGIGREHALAFAREGAKLVVNDLGGARDGTGGDAGPAQRVVQEIEAIGGQAVANTDDISSWDGAQRFVQQGIDAFGTVHVLVNNAGILRDRMMVNMTEAEWDAVITVHLKGTFAPGAPRGGVLARPEQGRHAGRRPDRQHQLVVRDLRQRRAGQLRCGQGGHRRRSP